ncbi:HrpE/YscL family type III secretion apparatus protein [Flavivirga amylovorans]|uniref:HrpE/YscL family type III secretion apparatus protein n=1 Tax=Flavivirga amylovorans TaxID=870486 RepID=A0ABT8WZA3_9FLAO|nr:HrpE/YscL family type III secretion apparatus protein [Flavivirga amylovorans]MDO5986709.1 HrpE/YscL family type III secretion apparatus protein [Flavivirga amylovorans]
MSDKTLDKLIATLKYEAIEAAEKSAKIILEEAHSQARKIIKEAEEKKKQVLIEANKKAESILNKGESALQQAARDLNIRVQNDLIKLFDEVLKKEVSEVFTPDLMKTAVLKVIENLDHGAELKLPNDFEQKLIDHVHLRIQISDDLIFFNKDDSILGGLSIYKMDEGWSYHITPEEVATLINNQLSTKWSNILKKTKNA